MKFLCEHNVRNSAFVDDFLIMMREIFATDNIDFVLHTLQDLGWQINWDKSDLVPSDECEFIGFIVRSKGKQGPWLQVTQKKLHKLRRHIMKVLKDRVVKARFLAKIGGECIAMMRA